ncbi:MAG: class II aldolase/adducin family protein [Leptospiraceae bacterium]|nr:class II aldolase/adducin family protein [Leptospiraceae bacterium]MDW7975481.1 class II aldolase/adducin family protein [Leptospiraceae bacterium]
MNVELMGLLQDVIEVGKRLYEKGMIVALEGNLSIQYEGKIIITASAVHKGNLSIHDFVVVDFEGNVLESHQKKPSTELPMHLNIYKSRPNIKAIVHAHPPYCIAATLNGISFMDTDLPEVHLILGDVPTAPYALTGTIEMFHALEPFLDSEAILLSHHGAITFGSSIWVAYNKMELLEHTAKILCIAHSIGNIQKLPEYRKQEIRELRKKRIGYGS